MAYSPDQFAALLLATSARVDEATERVVKRAAQNVKDGAQRNVLQSAPIHNAGAHKAITYDDPATTGGRVHSEVGYDKSRRGGALGNLLEFGGGGDHSPPHRDLARALETEEPRFIRALEDLGEELLGR